MSNNEFFDQMVSVIAGKGKNLRCMSDSEAWLKFQKDASELLSLDDETGVMENTVHAVPEAGTLDALCTEVLECRRCPLCEARNNVVFGEGDPHAQLMFIGEGPGFDEDRLGRPFVGKAGQLLDKMILAMQFSRPEVYICNIVKCRPPGNRVPMPEEAEACSGWLTRQIELVSPKVIVLLGATAAHYLLGQQEGITRIRGRWFDYKGIPVMPTFHPAFLLRQESAKREAWQDLQQVMAKFNKYHKR